MTQYGLVAAHCKKLIKFVSGEKIAIKLQQKSILLRWMTMANVLLNWQSRVDVSRQVTCTASSIPSMFWRPIITSRA